MTGNTYFIMGEAFMKMLKDTNKITKLALGVTAFSAIIAYFREVSEKELREELDESNRRLEALKVQQLALEARVTFLENELKKE